MNTLKGMVAGAILATVSVTGAWADSSDPIRIPINEWTGQHVSAHITGTLLQKAGYNIEYVTAGAVPQFAAIAQGDLQLQPEVWTNNVGDVYPKAVESGDIVVLGQLGLKPQEGWIYPPYMNDKCPGLPSYDALYECAQAFAAADTFPKGRLITYPADWGTRSKDVVAMIELPFEPVAGGSEGAMIAELKSAVAAEQPILMMFWQPHWLFADIDFDWVSWDAGRGRVRRGIGPEARLGLRLPAGVGRQDREQGRRDEVAGRLQAHGDDRHRQHRPERVDARDRQQGPQARGGRRRVDRRQQGDLGTLGRGREGRHELVIRRREGDAPACWRPLLL